MVRDQLIFMKWLIVVGVAIIISSIFFIQSSESVSSNSTCTTQKDCKISRFLPSGGFLNVDDLCNVW